MHIVTGMHRSGTSFISQALHFLDADFGDPERLIKADKWNQAGYFESIDIVDINNRMILGDGARIEYWLTMPESGCARLMQGIRSRKWKYLVFPKDKTIAKNAQRYQGRMHELLNIYRGKYVKDPRFCLTVGRWSELEAPEGVAFIYRNPSDVVGSINQRERLPRAFGYKYWYGHMRSMFHNLPGDTPIFFFKFDNFFSDSDQASEFDRIQTYLGLPIEKDRMERLKSKLDIRLRTQRVQGPANMPVECSRTLEALDEFHILTRSGPVVLNNHDRLRQRIIAKG